MGNAPAAQAPFACALAFALKDAKGTIQSEGGAKAILDGETFTLDSTGG